MSFSSIGVPLISSALQAWGQSRANRANRQEAQRGRDFTERMSSTAHQREVKDLRLAGLNPILSAAKGASTPGANVATNQQSITKESVNSALAAKLQKAQITNLETASVKNSADANLTNAKEGLIGLESDVKTDLQGLYNSAKNARSTHAELMKKQADYDNNKKKPKLDFIIRKKHINMSGARNF